MPGYISHFVRSDKLSTNSQLNNHKTFVFFSSTASSSSFFQLLYPNHTWPYALQWVRAWNENIFIFYWFHKNPFNSSDVRTSQKWNPKCFFAYLTLSVCRSLFLCVHNFNIWFIYNKHAILCCAGVCLSVYSGGQ